MPGLFDRLREIWGDSVFAARGDTIHIPIHNSLNAQNNESLETANIPPTATEARIQNPGQFIRAMEALEALRRNREINERLQGISAIVRGIEQVDNSWSMDHFHPEVRAAEARLVASMKNEANVG